MFCNFFQHPFGLLEHEFVFKPDYGVAERLQVFAPFNVISGLYRVVMYFAIQFYYQFFGRAVEVCYVIIYAVLPPEFAALQLAIFQ